MRILHGRTFLAHFLRIFIGTYFLRSWTSRDIYIYIYIYIYKLMRRGREPPVVEIHIHKYQWFQCFLHKINTYIYIYIIITYIYISYFIYISYITKTVRTSPSSWNSKAPTWLRGTSISAWAPRVPRGSLRRAVPSPADAGTTRLGAHAGETVPHGSYGSVMGIVIAKL